MVESYDDWSGYDCGDGYIELYDDYCSDYYTPPGQLLPLIYDFSLEYDGRG